MTLSPEPLTQQHRNFVRAVMGNPPPKAPLARPVLLNENSDELFMGGLVQPNLLDAHRVLDQVGGCVEYRMSA